MSDIINISDITTISSIINSNLDTYSSYAMYVENRTTSDLPMESQYSLYDLFDSGINNLSEDDWEIIVSEKVDAESTTIELTENQTKIQSSFGVVDNDTIEYDDIVNDLVEKLRGRSDYEYAEVTGIILNWFGKYFDLTIGTNPELSDDSNLILVQSLLVGYKNGSSYVQRVIESILSKAFRNILQIVRVCRDYRLYGKNSTIFTGKSNLTSKEEMGKYASIPASCWTTLSGHYIVGNSAYTEPISAIGLTIAHSINHSIAPSSIYGLKEHTHQMACTTDGIPSTITIGENTMKTLEKSESLTTTTAATLCPSNEGGFTEWKSTAESQWSNTPANLKPKGFVTIETDGTAKVKGTITWSYSWSSNGLQTGSPPGAVGADSVFKFGKTILPTYASNVWKWTGDDKTNITNPTQYIDTGN